MKTIEKDTTVTLVTVTPGELLIAPTGLSYQIMVGDEKKTLQFKAGKLQIDKVEDKALYEVIKARIDAQFVTDEKGEFTLDTAGNRILRGDKVKLPFMLLEDFEETLAKFPQRISLPNGEVVELTPAEIAELIISKKAKTETPEVKAPKKKKEETV